MRGMGIRVWALSCVVVVAGCDCGDGGLSSVYPEIDVTPNVIAFGNVNVGVTKRVVVTVSNLGAAPLEASAALAERSHESLGVDATPFVVAPGASHEVEVTFSPTTVGSAFGAVIVTSNDLDEPEVVVPIEGVGERRSGPAVAVCVESTDANLARTCGDALAVDFGQVVIGTTYQATVTVTSVGTEPIVLTSARFTQDSHPFYVAAPPDQSGTLMPEDSRTIVVRFTPTDALAQGATLEVVSSDSLQPTVPIVFAGRGVESSLCLSEGAIDFGVVSVGASEDRDVTLENCGMSELVITSLTIESNPEFTIEVGPTTPLSMAVGETTTLTLRYTPADNSEDRDRLRIESNFPTSFVTLIGKAAACDLEVLPSSVDFGAATTNGTRDRTVLLQNNGTVACAVSGLAMSPMTSAEFTVVQSPPVPITVAPGASVPIDLQYAPTDAGMDTGVLYVDSDDGMTPRINVPLTGRRLGVGECQLTVTPDPIAFGGVAFGGSATQQVTITNAGSSFCTISIMRLSMSTSLEFSALVGNVPMLLPGGGNRTIDVTYTPRQVGNAMGELEIFTGLIPTTPDFVIPISAAATGPRACVSPNPVVFGTHPVGTLTTRMLNVYSCGTQDLQVSSLALVPPTTSEMSLYMPPSTPLTIPAGQTQLVELHYTGIDQGRDDGVLAVQTNDPVEPVVNVDLIAHTSAGPCGDIQGKICDLTMSGPVDGALVYVTTPTGRIQTLTNASGDYVLTCVPPGAHTVTAEKGQWSTTFTANVTAYATTVIPGQMCLDPMSADVAVIYGEYDSIEAILGTMGVPHDFYMDTGMLVQNAMLLNSYDVVFINCGWEEFVGLSNSSRQNLQNFVNNGGSVYASDWAYDIIEVLWPNAIDFDGDDTTIDAAQAAGPFNGPVTVVEPSLRTALGGRQTIPIDSCCTAMTAAGAGTTTYLSGQRLNTTSTHPFMVGFEPTATSGRVFYTDFHNNGQPDIQSVFRWLILQL